MITDAMVDAAVAAWENRYDADCDPGERWRDNRYHAMRAALSAALPAAWQDIETAPRDGTVILLANRSGVWIGKYQAVYVSGYRPDNPWFSLMLNVWYMDKYASLVPTHWMPLPAPPADGGGR